MCIQPDPDKRPARLRLAWLLLLSVIAVLAGSAVTGTALADDEPRGKLLLLLDSSGSMKEPDASGATKIQAAKQALNTVVDKLPGDAQVGLRVYGAKVFDRSDPGACTDSQLVVPIQRANKPALKTAIAGYQPHGETPIAYSLRKAAGDVGASGPRTILLVSDGEETCDADPCVVAKEIHDKGIDLRIDVVGLHVDAATKRQLACIADNGGGTYYDAEDAGDLSTSLDQSAVRAFKDFEVSGTPVKGGLQPGQAPSVGPGQYTDTIGQPGQSAERIKYYLLERTPGATIHVAATSRPKKRTGRAATADELTLKLLTPAGEECTWGHGAAFEWSATRDFLTATVFQGPGGNTSGSIYVPDECKTSGRLLLQVERGKADQATPGPEDPYELLVTEEPPLAGSAAGLPEPLKESDLTHGPLPAGTSQGERVGGGGFADAATLTPGNWTGTLRPGEQLFYRVRADWGQSAAVTFRIPANPALQDRLGTCGPHVSINSYAPNRSNISLPGGSDGNSTGTTRCYGNTNVFHATLPEVRYRNREGSSMSVRPVSLAGFYYFAIQQNATDDGAEYQEPIEISGAVKGEPAGAPAYREPNPATEPPPSREQDQQQVSPGPRQEAAEADDPVRTLAPVAAVVGGGVLTTAGVVLFVVFLLRRKRSA